MRRPRPRGPAVEQAVQLDLAQTSHDIPIPLNDRVLNYVELFQGRLREFLAGGLQRGSKYLPMVQSVFRAEGVPLDLAYVPLIESAFKPTALSRASARGMWQFMRPTAGDFGLKQDWYIDERADPEKATRAAAKYFKQLYGMFSDWHLAMASYNGGPGRVQRAVKASGIADFWELTDTDRFLPRETREYVPMILAAVIIAKNPDAVRIRRASHRSARLRQGAGRHAPSTCVGWPSGPARPSTKSRPSTRNFAAGRRRCASRATR